MRIFAQQTQCFDGRRQVVGQKLIKIQRLNLPLLTRSFFAADGASGISQSASLRQEQ